jgi:ribosomal protein S27AE
VTHTILIEFDPKDASPLEIINTLDKMMQTNLEEGKITEYNIAIPINDDIDMQVIELTIRQRKLRRCPECGSAQLHVDDANKEVVCSQCGYVIKEEAEKP